MRTIQRDIVGILIFSKDGYILQGRKNPKDGGVYDDCWLIPGGGIKPGEDHRSALLREAREELDLDLSTYPAVLVNETRGVSEKTLQPSGERVSCEMQFHDYRFDISDRNAAEIIISLNDDLAEYRWSHPSDLKTLKLSPPSVELFTKLGYL